MKKRYLIPIAAIFMVATTNAVLAQQSLVYQGASYSRAVFPDGPYRGADGPGHDHRFSAAGYQDEYNFRKKDTASSYEITESGELRRWESKSELSTSSSTWQKGEGLNFHRKF